MAITVPGGPSPVQFSSARGLFAVEAVLDPGGAPSDVLDAALGCTFAGRVVLPRWLTGTGVVRLLADQLGGPFDQEIGRAEFAVDGAGVPAEPPPGLEYAWTVAVPGGLIAEAGELYHLAALFELRTEVAGRTDIGAVHDLGVRLVV